MREHRLRVYRKDPDGVEPLPDIHPPQDSDTDSEIGSVIVVGDENGLGGDGIDEIIDTDEPEDDSDCNGEPGDYPTPQSMAKQADSEVLSESSSVATPEPSTEPEPASSEPVPSESSSSRAETPSSSSSEPSRTRAGRPTVLTDQAQRNLQRTRNIYRINRRSRVARGSNFAIQPVFSSFYAGSAHRLHRRDLPPRPRGWKEL